MVGYIINKSDLRSITEISIEVATNVVNGSIPSLRQVAGQTLRRARCSIAGLEGLFEKQRHAVFTETNNFDCGSASFVRIQDSLMFPSADLNIFFFHHPKLSLNTLHKSSQQINHVAEPIVICLSSNAVFMLIFYSGSLT